MTTTETATHPSAESAGAARPGDRELDPQTPTSLLVLGASGDLTARLLLPGIGALVAAGRAGRLHLRGCGDVELSPDEWAERVRTSFATAGATDQAPVRQVLADTEYVTGDVTVPGTLTSLLDGLAGAPAIFFALPPAVTIKACEALREVNLPDGLRLVVEKPFGTDEESAAAFNTSLLRLVPEERIHRVDHFLGKSTVLNLLGLRFGNRVVEPLLSSTHVERIDIVYDETLGLEGRAGYYDHAGAMVDMIQSHLLQAMAVLTMEAPATLSAEDVRELKAGVLRATHLWNDDPVASSRRARYTAGTVGDRELPSYVEEDGVDPANDTETFSEVTVEVDTWRWRGVPITLRSAKAIGNPRQEAVITFRPANRIPDGFCCHEGDRERLLIGLGHTQHLALDLTINGPGDPFQLDRSTLMASFGEGDLPPYGEVIAGVLTSDPLLSVRGDTAEQCWRIVQPVRDAWRAGDVPMQEYAAGSAGPADVLVGPEIPARDPAD